MRKIGILGMVLAMALLAACTSKKEIEVRDVPIYGNLCDGYLFDTYLEVPDSTYTFCKDRKGRITGDIEVRVKRPLPCVSITSMVVKVIFLDDNGDMVELDIDDNAYHPVEIACAYSSDNVHEGYVDLKPGDRLKIGLAYTFYDEAIDELWDRIASFYVAFDEVEGSIGQEFTLKRPVRFVDSKVADITQLNDYFVFADTLICGITHQNRFFVDTKLKAVKDFPTDTLLSIDETSGAYFRLTLKDKKGEDILKSDEFEQKLGRMSVADGFSALLEAYLSAYMGEESELIREYYSYVLGKVNLDCSEKGNDTNWCYRMFTAHEGDVIPLRFTDTEGVPVQNVEQLWKQLHGARISASFCVNK